VVKQEALEGNRADRPYSSPDWPIHSLRPEGEFSFPIQKTNLVHCGPLSDEETVGPTMCANCGAMGDTERDLEGTTRLSRASDSPLRMTVRSTSLLFCTLGRCGDR